MNKKVSGFLDRLQNRGVHSGLNQTSNSIKMAAYIVAPFIGAWFAVQLLFDKATTQILTPIIFGAWLVGMILYFFNLQSKLVTYTAFPQSHWRFPDGQQIALDILVPPAPNDYKLEHEYTDGSKLYTVPFKDKIMYQDPRREYPDIFDRAAWKLPAEWTKSFDFNALGEMFFEGMFVSHSKSENIEVSVMGWKENGSNRIPYCVVTSCSQYYRLIKASGGKQLPNIEAKAMPKVTELEAQILILEKDKKELQEHNGFLEVELEQASKKDPDEMRKGIDRGIASFEKRHKTIMNAGKGSLLTRLLNGKYIALAIGIGLALFAFWRMGWL
jgi:hypothetical protein